MAQVQELKIQNIDICDLFYPIGSIYETTNVNFNPSEVWGGTWNRVKGKVLVGVDESDADFATVKKTGGNKTVTLTQSNIPYYHIGFIPAVVPGVHGNYSNGGVQAASVALNGRNSTGSVYGSVDPQWGWNLYSNGGGTAHTNLQPYYTVYIWERVA